MIDAKESRSPSVFRRVFYGHSELRAGWRLLIFLAIVVALGYASNQLLRRLLHGADDTTLFLVGELMDFLIFLFASWIMGRIEGRTIAALQGADIGKWAILYALVFLLVALREEFRARGYALYTLSAGVGFWPAAILSAAYFGYSHHNNTGEDWIGLFNAGAFGLLLCFLLRRTGNLWLPIGFHMAFDWGETYFYGVADSGQTLPGHFLNSSTSGVAWLSGGTVGPEGSVLCTLLILLVWLICAGWLREDKYPTSLP
ncbi:MAG: CPBP family intramembrane glutamic endopeptidase [Candidatus Acidiferrales bacterium]